MVRVVGDAEHACDDFGDAGAGPDIADEAEGRGSTSQEQRKASKLVRSEAGRSARREPRAHGLDATSASAFEPLADSALGNAKGLGNFALLPPVLMELPGTKATPFAPILWIRSGLHNQYATMVAGAVLNLYAVVSSGKDGNHAYSV